MRHLIYVPFLAVLMGSDCDGGSEEQPPVDTSPPTCEGLTVLTPADCEALEEGLFCDLTGDLCAGNAFDAIVNTGTVTTSLSPSATQSLPFLTLEPGETSSAWSGSTMRGIGVGASGDFELTISWQ